MLPRYVQCTYVQTTNLCQKNEHLIAYHQMKSYLFWMSGSPLTISCAWPCFSVTSTSYSIPASCKTGPIECPLFTQSCLINLPDWPILGIAPRVNWVKFGSNWVKNEVAPRFCIIAQFFTDSEGPMGVSRRKTPLEGSHEMENWAIWRKLFIQACNDILPLLNH